MLKKGDYRLSDGLRRHDEVRDLERRRRRQGAELFQAPEPHDPRRRRGQDRLRLGLLLDHRRLRFQERDLRQYTLRPAAQERRRGRGGKPVRGIGHGPRPGPLLLRGPHDHGDRALGMRGRRRSSGPRSRGRPPAPSPPPTPMASTFSASRVSELRGLPPRSTSRNPTMSSSRTRSFEGSTGGNFIEIYAESGASSRSASTAAPSRATRSITSRGSPILPDYRLLPLRRTTASARTGRRDSVAPASDDELLLREAATSASDEIRDDAGPADGTSIPRGSPSPIPTAGR